MDRLRELYWKNKFPILFAVSFSIIYVTIGCLWFLAPNDKYLPPYPGSLIQIIVPILGLATFFLNFSPYVFIPALAAIGCITGLIIEFWLDPKQPITLAGTSILMVLTVINYCVGLFMYVFFIMIWLD